MPPALLKILGLNIIDEIEDGSAMKAYYLWSISQQYRVLDVRIYWAGVICKKISFSIESKR
jgi:hypothetical protein